jgi:formylglycine-generating enzyme required for sulfatase activity
MVRDFHPITAEQARDQLDGILTGRSPTQSRGRRILLPAAGSALLLALALGFLKDPLGILRATPSPQVQRATSLGRRFVEIPGGSFLMGRNAGDSDVNAPQAEVTIDPFLIQSTEVPLHLWNEVRNWAQKNGYPDLNPGTGRGADHPVIWVQWFDAVKWCNAWSEKEGLKPFYHISPRFERSQVYRTNDIQVRVDWVDWTADGYRLPTEAEWEKAARGGMSASRYFWGDTITHDNANYRSLKDPSYDLSPTQEFHPRFSATKMPFTSPIGSFAPNAFGLHDTSGNVWEWTWDAYDPEGHRIPPAPNPRGAPVESTGRVIKGGCWNNSAHHARPTFRGGHGAQGFDPYLGFRCARNKPIQPVLGDSTGAPTP